MEFQSTVSMDRVKRDSVHMMHHASCARNVSHVFVLVLLLSLVLQTCSWAMSVARVTR